MKKINKLNAKLNDILAKNGINARAGVIALMIISLVTVSVAVCTDTLALIIALAAVLIYVCVNRKTMAPTASEIITACVEFLERTANVTAGSFEVFKCLYYDALPVEDGTIYKWLRWESRIIYRNGMPIYQVKLMRIAGELLSKDTLKKERLIIQGLLTDDLRRFNIPMVAHPFFADGTPTISLLDIASTETGVIFSFVWVDNETASRYAFHFGTPRENINKDDTDF